MNKYIVYAVIFLGSLGLQAQYTETINSNRPGNSQGAFAVGNNVLQLETGLRYGQRMHNLRNTEINQFGVDYALRYGIGFEQLEINWMGSFLSSTERIPNGADHYEMTYSNFESNTFGLKYLIYDPYRKRSLEEPNIRSWKANFKFRWRDLIPAVSLYAGANLLFGDNPYAAMNEEDVTPKVALITQHNYRNWVLVMNFTGNNFMNDELAAYSGTFTLTHAINRQFAVFGEYQAIKSDFYSDDLFRAGGAYLLNKDFQIDLGGLINFKDTPSRWQITAGISYRLDMHNIDEFVVPKEDKEELEEEEQKKEEMEEKGLPLD